MPKRMVDPEYMKKDQYNNADKLAARIRLHKDFPQHPDRDLQVVNFDHMLQQIPEEATILECGTGRGDLWKKNLQRIPAGWDLTLTDFSKGMLDANREHMGDEFASQVTYQQADVQDLPFQDNTFDAVIANFMLYHVPNLDQALAEIRRVLKPNSVFMTCTNGQNHLTDLYDIVRHFDPDALEGQFHFTTQSGKADLAPYFDHVEFIRYENDLWVTHSQAIMNYIDSMMVPDMALYTPEKQAEIQADLDAKIRDEGGILIRKDTGLFIAR